MLITPALFAANMVAARWAQGAAIPPLFLAFGRWALAFLLILPFVAPRLWAWRQVLMANWARLLLLAGLGMGVAVAPQYIGAHNTSAANVALIFAVCPVLIALIETIVWRAPLQMRQAVGMLLAIAGVLVVVTRGEGFTGGALAFGQGDLWVLLAACGWALYTVFGKRHPLPRLPGTVRLAALIGGGALVLAPFALLESASGVVPDFGDGRLYAALCFLAIVPSLGAYYCYDRLVGVAGAAGAGVSMYMVPLYAALAAWPLLGEAPQVFHLAGFGLILAGVLLSGMKKA
ncbi:DMT family transporter [Noviherbaspirillum sedimenti]|uniref:DMT family transporter n=2 Tax=Noviherbaspirillum sedimenti TaxID=2320865 RepID=A0A3A3G6S1_9BURK|nr:DMT family transporter [Noviherbaspirillum sedimenti]